MFNPNKINHLIFAACFAAAFVLAPSQSKASDCPGIPDVEWWGNTSAKKISAYVESQHDGDWNSYIKKWEGYEARMSDAMYRGKFAKVNAKGMVLKGEDLARYIRKVSQRVSATRCFADEQSSDRMSELFNNMETAAGGIIAPQISSQNDENCPEFSRVEWWETNHDKVISYVSRKHGGDWTPYLAKWSTHLDKMKVLHNRGGTAVLKSKKLKLEGKNLLNYVESLKGRLAVSRCLAKREKKSADIVSSR